MHGQHLGFVGLGTMGRPMAARLIAAGHRLTVHSRTAAHARDFAELGAEVVSGPAEVSEAAEIVFSCLLDDAVVEEVWLGGDGLLSATRASQVLVEHGTFSPELARRLSEASAARGASFLDAPVTGGPEGASAGTLVTMVGGDANAFEHVRPLLDEYSSDVVRVGPSGTGLELKLVNQMLVACHVAAACEAAAMLRRLKIDPALAETVLMGGWAASAMLGRSLPRLLGSETGEAGARVALMVEVQRLVADLADEVGLDLQLTATARRLFDRAAEEGFGSEDLSAVISAVERR